MNLILTIWLGIACNGQDSNASDSNTTVLNALKSTSASTESNNSKNQRLPDLLKGLSRGGCDNGPGDNGAASFFYTDLTLEGENVSGKEEWLLFANERLSILTTTS